MPDSNGEERKDDVLRSDAEGPDMGSITRTLIGEGAKHACEVWDWRNYLVDKSFIPFCPPWLLPFMVFAPAPR